MTTPFNWPTWLSLAQVEIGLQRQTVQHRSPSNGAFQSVDLLSWFWVMTVSLPPKLRSEAGKFEALFNAMVGGAQPIYAWHFTRPVPTGTMRGTPTLAANAAQFANTFSIQTTAGATLLAGDMIGIGSELLQVLNDATADGSGVMSVTTANRSRNAYTTSQAVVWNKPSAQFVVTTPNSKFVHTPDAMQSTSFDLVEVW